MAKKRRSKSEGGYADAKGRWNDSQTNLSKIVIPDEVADAIDACKDALDSHFSKIKERYSFSIIQLNDVHSGNIVAAFSPYVGTVAPRRNGKESADGKG